MHGILESAAALYQQALFAPEGAAALSYLRGRGLTDATIRAFGLGYAGEGRGALARRLATDGVTLEQLLEAGLLRPGDDGAARGELFFNRVMFPIRDRRGRVISFGGRILGDGQPKYVNGPETPLFSKRRTLYGLDLAREAVRGGKRLVAVEGYMDVIALHQAGFTGAVAPLGTALTEDQLDLLWQLSPSPTLCFDGDAAGSRAAARAIDVALPRLASDRTVLIATLTSEEKDPDALIQSSVGRTFDQVLDSARPISEALFQREAREVGPLRIPEQHTALLNRLMAAADKISDARLRAAYRDELRYRTKDLGYQSRWAVRRGKAPPTPSAHIARPTLGANEADAERVRTLIAVLVRHPILFRRLEEPFATLPLPPAAQRLLEGLQTYADAMENLDFAGLIAHLTALRLADDVAWALGNGKLPLAECAGADVAAGVAEAGWWQIYGLMRRSSLEADVAAARREFAATPTGAAQARLIALAEALTAARGGGLAPDAVPED
jgi:DNA primase